jgi:SAM-dependent methyltransferase
MSNGWEESAAAWIDDLGERGDFSREFVLDVPMMERMRAKRFANALDVGCGEGRFCRMMQRCGIRTIGIDPTNSLVARARELDPGGDYRLGKAEAIDFPDETFELVVGDLVFIDIPDIPSAIREMVRVLRPGGTLLIANLTSFNTAAVGGGWTRDASGELRFSIDHYLTERVEWVRWRGIRIQNWHRPLSFYMSLLIAEGLNLRYFSEPAPIGGEPAKADRYRRVPWSLVMEWEKERASNAHGIQGSRIIG